MTPADIRREMHLRRLTAAEGIKAATTGNPAPPSALCVYTPWSSTRDLGAEYNRVMARLGDGEWAIFLDHDAATLIDAFWQGMAEAIRKHPDAGAIVTYTNKAGNPAQATDGPAGADLEQHAERAREIRRENGNRTTDVTAPRMTGVCFATSKAAWLKAGPFASGMGEVDNKYAATLVAAGLRIWRADGVYVYHEKRTSGRVAAGPCKEPATTDEARWQTASAVIRREGGETYAMLVDALERRTDLTPCQLRARRRTIADPWRASMRVSVVIPAREEEPDELAATVRSFRDAGAHEVVVVDDGTAVPVQGCGADVVIRHDEPRGVSASRNEGLAAATGNVVAFSDSHCRVCAGSDFLAWCYGAYTSDNFLTAAVGGYGTPTRLAYGCDLPLQGWYLNVSPCPTRRETAPAPYGSVYAAARWTWARVGGWMPTQGWGYNEQAMGLACLHAGVTVRVTPEFRVLHRYRPQRRFVYPVNSHTLYSNAVMVLRVAFGEETWREFFLPLVTAQRPEALEWFRDRWPDAEFAAVRKKYEALRRCSGADMAKALGLGTGLTLDGIATAEAV